MRAILLSFFLACAVKGEEQHYTYCSEAYPTIVLSGPTKKASWATPPDIRMCPGTNIGIARVSRALNYWEHLGYKFGNILIEENMYNCLESANWRQEIRISLPSQEFDEKYLAMTRIATHKVTGEIVQATIYITRKTSERRRVLEHEIGHAIGWQHYPQSRHIMNPDWEAGGYDSYGLRQ